MMIARTVAILSLLLAMTGCKKRNDDPEFAVVEVKTNLRSIAMGAKQAYLERTVGGLPGDGSPSLPPSSPLTPAEGCCANGQDKCIPDYSAWDHPTWHALAFSIDEPHVFQYQFESGENGFVARAVGDVDCDGKSSVWEFRAHIEDGEVVLGDFGRVDERQ